MCSYTCGCGAARRGKSERPGQVRSGQVGWYLIVSDQPVSASFNRFLFREADWRVVRMAASMQPPAASCRAPIGQCSGGHGERRRLNERTVMAIVRCING
ncbi:hypothetical protein V8C44DRAFT_322263 [Trichoderma aethiopicum]